MNTTKWCTGCTGRTGRTGPAGTTGRTRRAGQAQGHLTQWLSILLTLWGGVVTTAVKGEVRVASASKEEPAAGSSGPVLAFSGKVLAESIFGTNTRYPTYVFPGAGLAGLFQNEVTPFQTFNADQMFLLNGSRFVISASQAIAPETKASLVGSLSLNQGASRQIKEAYGMVESQGWTIKMGNTYGVEELMAVCPVDISQGSGGIYGGTYFKFLPTTTGVWAYPALLGDTGTSTKMVITTPRVGGLMVGCSYTPNTVHYGETRLNTGVSPAREPFVPFDLNSWSTSINYLTAWEGGSIGLSAGKLKAQTQPEKPLLPQAAVDCVVGPDGKVTTEGRPQLIGNELERYNTDGWQCGAAITLDRTSVAFEYIDSGQSHLLKNNFNPIIYQAPPTGSTQKTIYRQGITPPAKIGNHGPWAPKQYIASKAGNAHMWTVGVAQTFDAFGLSVTYLKSSLKTGFVGLDQEESGEAVAQGFAMAFQYNALPGFAPYMEFARFQLTNPDWAYIATMIPSLTKFEYTATPEYERYYSAFVIGFKLSF